jgi:hypothetical protein
VTTYSPALASQVGTLFSQLVPGFPKGVATTWATLESGVGNNPYGVTDGNGHLLTFASLQAGVQAAATLLLTSSNYSSVRAAVRTGDPNAVASALVASPWNTPGSPYYASGFTAAGYHIDLSTVPAAPNGNAGGATGPSYRGQGSGTVAQNTAPDSTSSNTSSVQSLAGSAAGAVLGFIPQAAVSLAILAVVLVLAFMGAQRLLPAAVP